MKFDTAHEVREDELVITTTLPQSLVQKPQLSTSDSHKALSPDYGVLQGEWTNYVMVDNSIDKSNLTFVKQKFEIY